MRNIDSMKPGEVGTATDGSAPRPIAAVRLIEDIDVTVEAFLSSGQLTVGALSSLDKGAVVPLSAPFNQLVELRLNGVAIARGELVAAGDRFGVRITELPEWSGK